MSKSYFYSILSQELSSIKERDLFRFMRTIRSAQGPVVNIDGRDIILLCSNNYLGLANHPELMNDAIKAINRYGVGSGASRLISGNMGPHEQLEQDIADFKQTESALVFNSGYHANIGIISAIAYTDTAVLSDELNHASIIDGIRLSKANIFIYRHRDTSMAEDILKSLEQKKKLIVTDSVFSMDGDIAPLKELAELAERYDALLMVDEAHATGILGKHGRGAVELFELSGRVHIQMGTLGKALGVFGAYAAGDRLLIDYLINKSRSFIFTTSLPPALCSASRKAIELIRNHPELREALKENIKIMRDGLRNMGFEIPDAPTPIIPVIIGDSKKTMEFSSLLFDRGVFVSGIRPPTVPPGTSRLRITVSASHTKEMLYKSLDIINTVNHMLR
ncbi:MAG: 8-amino-7-oxononanoate synthase [Deltaproteobacteria bacterium]|nr:8-amino-7-oxononanoate synthase [Deltaproteobacteria bacterium]MCL5792645.1 8-amino-7-oxononanoate synthase [Deltaproteobacteria bacterium]